MTLEICPICGHGLKRESREITYSYKNCAVEVMQPGLYCDGCGESILEGSDLKATRKAIHDMQCVADGLLQSGEVRRIRERIKMTQKDAGEIFGGGVNAFSRYERGEVKQPKSIDLLLRLVDRNIEELQEISPFHYELVAKSSARSPLRLVWEEKRSFAVSTSSQVASNPVVHGRKAKYRVGAQAEVNYG